MHDSRYISRSQLDITSAVKTICHISQERICWPSSNSLGHNKWFIIKSIILKSKTVDGLQIFNVENAMTQSEEKSVRFMVVRQNTTVPAVTKVGVTRWGNWWCHPICFVNKVTTFFSHRPQSNDLFSHRHHHHPVRLPSDYFSSILCKFSRKNYRLSSGCHPLDGVTRGGPHPLVTPLVPRGYAHEGHVLCLPMQPCPCPCVLCKGSLSSPSWMEPALNPTQHNTYERTHATKHRQHNHAMITIRLHEKTAKAPIVKIKVFQQ